ncbi:unnamed protein product [Blepharisma stoltei]|uniref:Phosphatidic acid phosphatase type 2/haloperoxidase domain-containing protein n=1 Tax=Blepharisma stoltei TaxID=1481888 RepID=A0AAU9JKR8_9CILI|nr:unnamed protein product [Blepharisma stoltei]
MGCVFLISLIAVFLTFLQIYEQERLEESSRDLTIWMQSFRNPIFDIFFEIIGEITSVCCIVIAGTLYLIGNRETGLIGLIASLFGVALSGFLKILFGHPRPFWKYSEIKGIQCPEDFGTPSAHALSAGAGLLVLGIMWLRSGNQNSKKVMIMLCGLMITAIDRIFLGAHFYFQVILGYIFAGLVASIVLHPKVYAWIYKIPNDISVVIKSHIIMIGFIAASIITAFYRKSKWNDSWSINFQVQCGNELTVNDAVYENFTDAALVCLVAGMIMGLFILKEKEKPKFSYGLVFLSMFFNVGIMGTMKVSDILIIKFTDDFWRILLICTLHYCCGVIHCYLTPVIINFLHIAKTPAKEFLKLQELEKCEIIENKKEL